MRKGRGKAGLAWVAAMALLLQALLPGLALAALAAAPLAEMPICRIATDAGGEDGQPVPAPAGQHPATHCVVCGLLAGAPPLPAQPVLLPVPAAIAVVAAAWMPAAKAAAGLALGPQQARAPPAAA